MDKSLLTTRFLKELTKIVLAEQLTSVQRQLKFSSIRQRKKVRITEDGHLTGY